MNRRIIIRCIAATACTGVFTIWALGSIFDLRSSVSICPASCRYSAQWILGGVGFDWKQSVDAPLFEFTPPYREMDAFVNMRAGETSFSRNYAGFAYGGNPSGSWKFIAIPLYFPSVLSALALAWVWRRTKRGNSATAFPIEAQQSPP